jgi:hypothetical protein
MPGALSIAVLAVGLLAALLGVWWICQGTGLVPVGFMANNMQWAYRGAVLVAFGAGMAVLSRRL